MFAIFEDGSHQYRVEVGTKLLVDYREGLNTDDPVTFDRVLLANGGGASQVGALLIDGSTVTAKVLTPEYKGEKIEVGKFKRRKNSRRHVGHRQKYTLVLIEGIDVPNLDVKEEKAEEPAAT